MTELSDTRGQRDPILAARAARLARLRDRFISVNLRSPSLRLSKATRTRAVDLSRMVEAAPAGLAALVARLGSTGGRQRVELMDERPLDPVAAALAADVAVLAHRAHAAWLESGALDLSVGWPFIEGRTADGTWLRGPLLIYPVQLETVRTGKHRFVLEVTGLPELNESLAQTLARLCGVTITLEAVLEDDDDHVLAVDDGTFRGLGACLLRLGLPMDPAHAAGGGLPPLEPLEPRDAEARNEAPMGVFRLRHHLVLGRFPASASALVGDYDELSSGEPTDAALGLAATLLQVDEAAAAGAAPPGESVAAPATGDLGLRQWLVLESDSSQDEVLRWMEGGTSRGLVVQGPPGTGKSQLIANLLAACVARGLTVLLACQKRAALDVVADRLASIGLSEPIALVHDAQRDRGALMSAVAKSLEAAEQREGGTSRAPDFEQAKGRLGGRLRVMDEAYRTVATPLDGHPPLAWLQERSADDDGRPLPDLLSWAGPATEQQAAALVPQVEAWSVETEPLAAPHPLAVRGDFGEADEQRLDASFGLVATVRDLLAGCPEGGEMTPEQARASERLWEQARPLLALLSGRDLDAMRRFALFWGWMGGGSEKGEWERVTSRLEQARRDMRPVPAPLLLEPERSLVDAIGQLERLAALDRRFFRFLFPSWWRLRRVRARLQELCSSVLGGGARSGLVPDLRSLCFQALEWQALIAEMPLDHPFVDFGFQGALEDIDRTLDGLRGHDVLVRAVHGLHRALAEHGGAYAALPDVTSFASELPDLPFFRAVMADSRKAETMASVAGAIDAAAGSVDEGLREECRRAVGRFGQGGREETLAALSGLLGARADAQRARSVDRLLAGAPEWARRFLRMWRRSEGHTVGEDLLLALDRAWARLALDGRPRSVVEAPLVDAAARTALTQDVAACRRLAHQGVVGAYRRRLADALADPRLGSSLRLLRHEASKQRRRLTLRQLVARFFRAGLGVVRPVWLSSPETVAAMFPLEAGLFDVVIFDEASQCPVESGLPVLVRGGRALVAGDDQQMPPSHFFAAATDDDEDGEEAVLATQSLLGLARIAFGQITLRWHYRSRHEALVSFSNHAFYGGRLLTAPRAGDGSPAPYDGLHWRPVRGLWSDSTNEAEADAVVALLAELLAHRDTDGGRLSVGVVTFNLPQADLIEERVDAHARRDPVFAELLRQDRARPAIEQHFVRNLENVQGDERDIIVFSVGYGASERGGPVHARFGPLGQAGGEKRLNVAITRARRGVHILCSFDPFALDTSSTLRSGPKLLKAYLGYVREMARGDEERARGLLAEAARLTTESGAVAGVLEGPASRPGRRVAEELAVALEAAGLLVARDHGQSALRIDLAVRRGPDVPFRLGVDCGAFLAEPDALVRDVYRPGFWERVGWDIVRVTPGLWRAEPERVVAELVSRAEG